MDLVRAESEPLVSNTYTQNELNRVMLNGYSNENGIKINRSIKQKKKIARAAHFFF